MLVDENGIDITVHQSWLDTYIRCGERGRLALIKPEWAQPTNDAAMIGTGTHAAIAAVLNKEIERTAIGAFAYETTLNLVETEGVRWVKYTLPGQLAEHARNCAEAWAKEILPSIEPGGVVEHKFKVPLFTLRGRTVHLEGTIDYAEPSGRLIDWKTASRKFDQRVKQRSGIQPTVYAVAAVHGALPTASDAAGFGQRYEYPVNFRFGVMVMGSKGVTTQLVDVQRTKAHEGWLCDQLETCLDLAEALGVNRRWPRDDDHFLCNEKWCAWWSMCKGARLSSAENDWAG